MSKIDPKKPYTIPPNPPLADSEVDKLDEILVNYVVGSRTYPLNMQRVTDEAKTALNHFYAEELLGLINDTAEPLLAKEDSIVIKVREGLRAELRQAIKDKWLGGSSNES